jgi:hypothetical protein|tara:strand:- start:16402 stop:16950 length:549 start_codon:yes stop_codon:yes gene_type:complete
MDFEQAASDLSTVNDEGMGQISKLAVSQIRLEDRIKVLNEDLKAVKGELRKIQEELLPEALIEFGITGFDTKEGYRVDVTKHYSASIPKTKLDEAFAWLNDNSYGDLIKNQVMTKFVRGEEAQAEALYKTLCEQGHTVDTKKWVEPMTLKAFARERVEAGDEFPSDLFGLYICDKAKITRKD